MEPAPTNLNSNVFPNSATLPKVSAFSVRVPVGSLLYCILYSMSFFINRAIVDKFFGKKCSNSIFAHHRPSVAIFTVKSMLVHYFCVTASVTVPSPGFTGPRRYAPVSQIAETRPTGARLLPRARHRLVLLPPRWGSWRVLLRRGRGG